MAMTSRNASTELINVHFDENRKRQGLTSISDLKEDEAGAVDDKSRKGSIDKRIVKLVYQINNISLRPESQELSSSVNSASSRSEITADESHSPSKAAGLWNYFTTSSCSGRAILFTHQDNKGESPELVTLSATDTTTEIDPEAGPDLDEQVPQLRKANQKKGCKWLYVTHDEISPDEFMNCWRNLKAGTYAVFKVEPSIFHIQCRTLTSARELVSLVNNSAFYRVPVRHVLVLLNGALSYRQVHVAASQSGFRNSGIVIGKDGKITVAVRSTIGLEVPLPVGLTENGNPIVSDQFLEYLINTGNETLRQNWARTERFAIEFQKYIRTD